jgi:uncharacterized protein
VAVLVELSNRSVTNSDALLERLKVLSEHVARKTANAEVISQLLKANPNSDVALAIWTGLEKGWPRGLIVQLPESVQLDFKQRFLSREVNLESKAAVLALAEKWTIGNLTEIVEQMQSELLKVVRDGTRETAERVTAWQQMIRLTPNSAALLVELDKLVTPQLDLELGKGLLSSLTAARVDGLAAKVLELRGRLSPTLAGQVLTMLLGRADTTLELLDAIEAGTVPWTALQLDQRQALLGHPTKAIAERAASLMKSMGAAVTSNRQGLVDEWMPVIEMSGNIDNGIAMYKKHCAACHQHGKMGIAIGPNLTGMSVHPKAELLVNVLDPSRSVENNFRTYQILTVDGAVINGMMAGESQNSIRIINTQGKEETILRDDIEQLSASAKSLMPEGFENSMTKQEVADLLAFMTNREKFTPLQLGKAATTSSGQGLFFNRETESEKVFFKDYGMVTVKDIPFLLDDPQNGKTPNIIMLRSNNGAVAKTLPNSTALACSGAFSAIHLLGGVAGWGYPASKEPTVSMIVRCHFQDGSTQDYPLINGKHIADFVGRVDVPESEYALEASGRQVRYLKIDINSDKPLSSIEFVKGSDGTAPIVFAVTVEASDANH